MHCPNCGQQQISHEIKFCSRCGFPLGLVAEILSNGGFLPQLAELNKKKRGLTKKHGVLFSVFWFMFFTLIMASFWAIVDVEELAAISAVVGIFGGLMFMIASLTLLKSSKPQFQFTNHPNNSQPLPSALPNNLYQTNVNALPPMQSQPVSSYVPPAAGSWKAPDTGDIVQPKSVIENTTKLFKREEK